MGVEWMTVDEVARELKLFTRKGEPNRRLVQLLAQRGDLPGEKISRYWRFKRDRMNKVEGRSGVPPQKRHEEDDAWSGAAKATAAKLARRERTGASR